MKTIIGYTYMIQTQISLAAYVTFRVLETYYLIVELYLPH